MYRTRSHLVRESAHFFQYGGHGSAPLSSTGKGDDTVAAHVVTATHYGPEGQAKRGDVMTFNNMGEKIYSQCFQRIVTLLGLAEDFS